MPINICICPMLLAVQWDFRVWSPYTLALLLLLLVVKPYPTLFAIPWVIAHQTFLFGGFPKQECWSELPFSSAWDLLDPGMEPTSLAWQVDSLPLNHLGNPYPYMLYNKKRLQRLQNNAFGPGQSKLRSLASKVMDLIMLKVWSKGKLLKPGGFKWKGGIKDHSQVAGKSSGERCEVCPVLRGRSWKEEGDQCTAQN